MVETLSALCRGQSESSLRHAFHVALENSGHATDSDVLQPAWVGVFNHHGPELLCRDLQFELLALVTDEVKCLLGLCELVAPPADNKDEVVSVAEQDCAILEG